jgi:cell wall-associated NlpC family hydrolase
MRTPTRTRPRRIAVASLVAGCVAALTLATAAGPAAANPPGPHDPIGTVGSVTTVTGGIRLTGWAADPDALTTNVTLVGLVDGRGTPATAVTSVANPTIAAKYHTGPTPGFTLTVPVPTGLHTVCLIVRNLGAGITRVLRCVPTPLGTTLTASQQATHNPRGAITRAWANPHSIHFLGWATDPDFMSGRSTVVLYVDGSSAATVTTTSYPQPRPADVGYLSAFDILVPVPVGAHLGCIWLVNVGLGANSPLGCRSMDNRGPAGTGTVPNPTVNSKIVTRAKNQLGDSYGWGATGPSSFDCSGLVVFSYSRFGVSTPRTSEDQFTAARLIPASRAVPGDLVFYHDSVGDVYHVGVYTGPSMTVAAIDESQGVDWQRIWDPSSATYGSFTHI